ncbi:SulP family inorganic anion transporter [Streptomyces sp. NPDC055059]|jgi:SulP family sulfate permease|uniref:SulP family inorganic anion transporter n=1 Tax=Streptomyces sp. NPDC127172 TaxID=3345382 RepID=UPI003633A00E
MLLGPSPRSPAAIALWSQSVLSAVAPDPGDLGALATLTLLVGVITLLMGLLKLGSVMSFVSTASTGRG